MTAFVSKYWEWGYRGVMLLGLGITIGTLKGTYATREDVQKMFDPVASRFDGFAATTEARLSALDKTMAVLIEQNKVNSRQDDILHELEMRLRAAELKQAGAK